MRNFIFSIFLVFLLGFWGCQKHTTFIYDFEKTNWNINDSVVFIYDVKSVDLHYDLIIFFRNHIDYQYQNLYILIETYCDDLFLKKDTLQYAISDKYGRWKGDGLGDTKDLNLLFKTKKKFEKTGAYKFKIQHGMRQNPLIGTNKIGLKIIQHD